MGVQSCSYTHDEKVWLNSKYTKTKKNKNLEIKFFELFQVFHVVEKQAYKTKKPTRLKIYHIYSIYHCGRTIS